MKGRLSGESDLSRSPERPNFHNACIRRPLGGRAHLRPRRHLLPFGKAPFREFLPSARSTLHAEVFRPVKPRNTDCAARATVGRTAKASFTSAKSMRCGRRSLGKIRIATSNVPVSSGRVVYRQVPQPPWPTTLHLQTLRAHDVHDWPPAICLRYHQLGTDISGLRAPDIERSLIVVGLVDKELPRCHVSTRCTLRIFHIVPRRRHLALPCRDLTRHAVVVGESS